MKKIVILIALLILGWLAYSYNSQCVSVGASGGILTTKGLYCYYPVGNKMSISRLSVLIKDKEDREWMEICKKKNPIKQYNCIPSIVPVSTQSG